MKTKTQELEIVTEDGEVVAGLPAGYSGQEGSLAVSLARAEVDQQIATSRALPRNIRKAVDNIKSLATLDGKSAEECVYALPRGGKPIKGPSIRLAEIIASQWGNCRVGARVVHVDRHEKWVEAEGVFHDLESNTATTSRVRRRIVDKHGNLYSDDMIIVTGNAACSIAKRNAILGAVPKAVWRSAYDAVESVISGDVKTLVERRERAMKAFATFGVTPERVCEALGVSEPDEITVDLMPILLGCHSALKSGEATVEELFPTKGEKPRGPKDLTSRLDAIVKASAASDAKDGDGEKTEASGEGADEDSGAEDVSPTEAAHAEGFESGKKGMTRKAMPAKYRGDKALSDAWLSGFEKGAKA
ncbi:hypothetical protein [Hoeflea sp.]|uniref:hypothetical protein n=1 Tax=Hoeflea sp. TaxID=1940281 RepID=UPI003B521D41